MTTTTVHARTSSLTRDLVPLTRPRIISVLLVTTVAPRPDVTEDEHRIRAWLEGRA